MTLQDLLTEALLEIDLSQVNGKNRGYDIEIRERITSITDWNANIVKEIAQPEGPHFTQESAENLAKQLLSHLNGVH